MIDLGNVYFCCDECPICEDLEYRLKLAEDGYGLQLEYCWCDKVGGKMYAFGYCPDAISQKRKSSKNGKRKTGSAYRRYMKKLKFERAKAIGDTTCNPAVGWVKSDFVDGEWGAVGAGEDFANAVLYLGNSPRDAVKVACELSCFVAEPIIEYSMQK